MKPPKNLTSGNNRELLVLMETLPFAYVFINENMQIEYLSEGMRNFLNDSEQIKYQDIQITQLIREDERFNFIEFINTPCQENKGCNWKAFKFKTNKGDCKQLLLSKIDKNDFVSPLSNDILIGVPLCNFQIDQMSNHSRDISGENDSLLNKYQSIFNNAVIGIIIFDNDHTIEEVNQTFADQFGISAQDVLGRNFEDIFPITLTEKLENLFQEINQRKNRLAKDVFTLEDELADKMILEISLSKFHDSCDSSDKNMMIVEDITKEKDTHKALIQSEKLALTGRLAASLAHEINNPLQASIGCLGLADEILEEEDRKGDLGTYITMALDELKRGARIVKKLRDLNRRSDPSEKTYIDIKKMIDDVLILAKNKMYDRNIVPVFPYQGMSPFVMATRDQIQSVLLNIIINAIDAMPEGGNIFIDLEITENPGGVIMKIRDTGSGMDQEVIGHLFDPFFTTKEEGLGLGLYLCNEIITNHRGYIKVDSEKGKGTIFSIWLPKDITNELEEQIK